MKILLSLTSTGKDKDFAEKIKQLEQLGIKEIALFLTAIGYEERQGLYRLLENSAIEKVPFVHLRNDMEVSEVDYLADRWKSKIFNIHGGNSHYPFHNNLGKYDKQIYLETQFSDLGEDELKKYAGICLDVSHYHDFKKVDQRLYRHYQELIKKYPCGCGHISAFRILPHYWKKGRRWHFSRHRYHWLREFNYIKNYKNILPPLMALELENSPAEQLKAKQYIEKILA